MHDFKNTQSRVLESPSWFFKHAMRIYNEKTGLCRSMYVNLVYLAIPLTLGKKRNHTGMKRKEREGQHFSQELKWYLGLRDSLSRMPPSWKIFVVLYMQDRDIHLLVHSPRCPGGWFTAQTPRIAGAGQGPKPGAKDALLDPRWLAGTQVVKLPLLPPRVPVPQKLGSGVNKPRLQHRHWGKGCRWLKWHRTHSPREVTLIGGVGL